MLMTELDTHHELPAETNPAPEDAALIAACLRNEQMAFASLYERFAPGLYRLCYGLVLNRQDAEDVVQESFVYAFKNLQRFDAARASFKTWLYTIAVCRCRNTYRRKRPQLIDLGQLFGRDIAAPDDQRPEAAVMQSAAQDAVNHALIELSPTLREAVLLRYGQGLTYREIAEVMDCPQKTAESRVRLAHDKLRTVLGSAGRGLFEELLSY
jgi:RNA polymerase sigma-70 factor, ECF subfamily